MTTSFETIPLGKEGKLSVFLREDADRTELVFTMAGGAECVLHWGLSRGPGTAWHAPPEASWPEGSSPAGPALQSPFVLRDGEASLTLTLRKPCAYSHVAFVLHFPETGKWENNRGKNFFVRLPPASPSSEAPASALEEWIGGRKVIHEAVYETKEGERIATGVTKHEGAYHVFLVTDIQGPLVLHWGVAEESPYEWVPPPQDLLPSGSSLFDGKACRTPFSPRKRLNRLDFTVPEEQAPAGIPFVLHQPEEERWIQDRGRNFYLRLRPTAREEASPLPAGLHELADAIIHAETGKGSWTLMHRFNLCHDLLDRAGSVEGLALLLVWVRFSAIRQLDWQRNYNTKPRELSHAQDRLTRKIAQRYGRMGESADAREILRLMMASLGRGGEGQRVRDEILNIMHRHHIKEVAGHFMEEWHQKLHNNTTPDDIAICEAYLDFLRSDGDVSLFYRTLERQGVSRERLESFERPIVTPPDFVAHLKDALIHDFEDYLRLLRSVHSGTDLESAFREARHLLGEELSSLIEDIRRGKDEHSVGTSRLAGEIARARALLGERLGGLTDTGHIRDALYLDLSLEEFFRVVIERSPWAAMEEADLYALVTSAVRNISCSYREVEFDLSLSWWERLVSEPGLSRDSRDWALHARAVAERLGRALGSYMDRHHRLLQPIAEYLGGAFHADRWTVTLFSEELVRGLPAFGLSQTLRRLNPLLRERAELGSWQVISPATASGRVRVVEDLRAVHAMGLEGPSIVLAERVRGDEEPPPEVRAVITNQPTDIVSHVAVRARNSALLFAVCYDEECLERLRSAEGRMLTLSVTNTGDVEFEEAETAAAVSRTAEPARLAAGRPEFRGYAITEDEFSPALVGGKSLNSRALKGRVPDSIHLPLSAAIPFGVFETVLEDQRNREVRKTCGELMKTLAPDPEAVLAGLRAAIGRLAPPEGFMPSLQEALTRSGMPADADAEGMWRCITRVWASKWNLRAYVSRRTLGIPHDGLLMAVLIQEAVRPDYAFVIHTVNPFTKDAGELYAELVPGLGETLVGNYPGRALGFSSSKEDPKPLVLSYPSKSRALYGGGLIFRSDSNGEDLAGYAGAGLYDSVSLTEPEAVAVDCTKERLLWDEAFRDGILGSIAEAGAAVEEAMGGPQDIEGTYAGGRITVVQTRPQVGL